MFDSLRKRLKEAVDKVSKVVRDEKPEPEPLPEPVTETIENPRQQDIDRLAKAHEKQHYEKIEDTLEKEYVEEKLERYEKPQEDMESRLDKAIEEKKEEKDFVKELGEIEHEIRDIKDETHPKPKPPPRPSGPAMDLVWETEEEKKKIKLEDTPLHEIEKKHSHHIHEAEIKTVDELKEELERAAKPAEKHDIEPIEDIHEFEAEIETEAEERKEQDKGKKQGLFSRIFEKTIDEGDIKEIMRELEIALLENDVAIEVAEKIGDEVKQDLLNKSVRRGRIEELIKNSLRHAMLDVMSQPRIDIEQLIREKEGVFTIMFLGFNGTGKTTTLAKFAWKFRKFHPVVAAGDTFRAASIEQLEEHAGRAGFRVVKHQYGADSAAVIFDAKKAALASGCHLVLADTAGRAHSNVNLMDELKKLVRVNNPDLKILVLDSITGNDIFEQSRLFDSAVGVDAIILTKADVYDKGGAALSAAYTIKKPILYLGVGQEYEDLKEFNPQEIVDQILG